jgi:hypothetical protein
MWGYGWLGAILQKVEVMSSDGNWAYPLNKVN